MTSVFLAFSMALRIKSVPIPFPPDSGRMYQSSKYGNFLMVIMRDKPSFFSSPE
ncbi:MAG: hypothetical protein FWF53_10070 [Candidatus Azobacteroides sp.]|nr:hypothetical protein [Candidatus Azobacteroides sp.]